MPSRRAVLTRPTVTMPFNSIIGDHILRGRVWLQTDHMQSRFKNSSQLRNQSSTSHLNSNNKSVQQHVHFKTGHFIQKVNLKQMQITSLPLRAETSCFEQINQVMRDNTVKAAIPLKPDVVLHLGWCRTIFPKPRPTTSRLTRVCSLCYHSGENRFR
jgi:hypothetical protein